MSVSQAVGPLNELLEREVAIEHTPGRFDSSPQTGPLVWPPTSLQLKS